MTSADGTYVPVRSTEQPSKRHRGTSQRLMNLKLNAAWVNLPIIRTQKLPIHIDRQCPPLPVKSG